MRARKSEREQSREGWGNKRVLRVEKATSERETTSKEETETASEVNNECV